VRDYADSDSFEPIRRRRRSGGRITEQEKARLAFLREDGLSTADLPTAGDRWSTWGEAVHGPTPHPSWVITSAEAEDAELGVLKTGKEADVHLLRRFRPGTDESVLLAAKRYRSSDHRSFHRDSEYLEGRRVRESRQNRAMASRSAFGRNLIAEQWAVAEFTALSRLWTAGLPVPYPVQLDGTEVLLEFLGDADGVAAPRLAQLRPEPDELRALWDGLLAALCTLAAAGFGHGDLSAYNVLVHRGEPILIDLPQVVDLAANPRGADFLARDVRNITDWFFQRGLPPDVADPQEVTALLLAEAGLVG
jgi:RIO kinase 1